MAFIVDKNGDKINQGDKVKLYIESFSDYPEYYHEGIYNVLMDGFWGLRLQFIGLTNTDYNNQYLTTPMFRINNEIRLEYKGSEFGEDYYSVTILSESGIKFNYWQTEIELIKTYVDEENNI